MPTTNTIAMQAKLSLTVQYATEAPELTRSRLRRWAQQALNGAVADTSIPANNTIAGASITIRLVDEAEGLELNTSYRERNYATNVLTFEYGPDPDAIIHGDIVLCVPVLEQEAIQQNKPLVHHAAHLVIHGVLHALGYDHLEADEAMHMETLETKLLAKINIPDPYAEIAP